MLDVLVVDDVVVAVEDTIELEAEGLETEGVAAALVPNQRDQLPFETPAVVDEESTPVEVVGIDGADTGKVVPHCKAPTLISPLHRYVRCPLIVIVVCCADVMVVGFGVWND